MAAVSQVFSAVVHYDTQSVLFVSLPHSDTFSTITRDIVAWCVFVHLCFASLPFNLQRKYRLQLNGSTLSSFCGASYCRAVGIYCSRT